MALKFFFNFIKLGFFLLKGIYKRDKKYKRYKKPHFMILGIFFLNFKPIFFNFIKSGFFLLKETI